MADKAKITNAEMEQILAGTRARINCTELAISEEHTRFKEIIRTANRAGFPVVTCGLVSQTYAVALYVPFGAYPLIRNLRAQLADSKTLSGLEKSIIGGDEKKAVDAVEATYHRFINRPSGAAEPERDEYGRPKPTSDLSFQKLISELSNPADNDTISLGVIKIFDTADDKLPAPFAPATPASAAKPAATRH